MRITLQELTEVVKHNNVDLLLEYHLNIFNLDLGDSGKTCLHIAAEKGSLEIVRYLLEQDCLDVNVQDDYQWTPLHYAVYYGHIEIIKLLVEAGANPNLLASMESSIPGQSPVHQALIAGKMEIAKILILSPLFDLNVKTGRESPIFYLFSKYCDDNEFWLGVLDYFDKDEFLEEIPHAELSFFHWCCQEGRTGVIQWILERYPNFDLCQRCQVNDWLPITYAATQGHLEIVLLLLGTGRVWDLNYQNHVGDSTLIKSMNHPESFELLLESGVMPLPPYNTTRSNFFWYLMRSNPPFTPRTKQKIGRILLKYCPEMPYENRRSNDHQLLCLSFTYGLPSIFSQLAMNDIMREYFGDEDGISSIFLNSDVIPVDSFRDQMSRPCTRCGALAIDALFQQTQATNGFFKSFLNLCLGQRIDLNFLNRRPINLFRRIKSFDVINEVVTWIEEHPDANCTLIPSDLTWSEWATCFQGKQELAICYAFKYLRENMVNSFDLINGYSIEEIDVNKFWVTFDGVVWSSEDLVNYVIHTLHGINRYDNRMPNVAGRKIWQTSDELEVFEKFHRNDGKKLKKYLSIGKLVNQLSAQQIRMIDRAANLFWAKGPIWKQEIRKILTKEELEEWKRKKEHRSQQEMPVNMSVSLKKKLEILKQEALFEFGQEYSRYSTEIKSAIFKISDQRLSENYLSQTFAGNDCIMCCGNRLWTFVERVKEYHHNLNQKQIETRPRSNSLGLTSRMISMVRPRRNSIVLGG